MRRYLGIAIAATIVIAGFALARSWRHAAAPAAPARHRVPTTSNISARDYVGPQVCGECHPDEHARWSKSLHRVMNQRAETAGAVIGRFDDQRLAYANGVATFTHDASGPIMITGATRYRVTRTIGVRGLQEYVGIEAGHTDEVRLPFAWWPRRAGWYPQPYFDPWLAETELDAYAPVREPWAERCPWCHSTYPFAERIVRASGPRHLGHGLEQGFTLAAADVGRERLAVEQQVTTGISCESCHLGGREHAAGAAIQFVPVGASAGSGAAKPTTFAAERRDAAIVNAVCAQCHSGPSPRLPDGTALRNSSEALDLAASPCTGIKCTDCHDPHRAETSEPRAVAACTHCHDIFAAPAAAKSHAGPGHESATCLDCHMPRIVMGIDHVVRTHRIAAPTDPRLYAEADPNACNLCHLDRTIGWTVAALHDRGSTRLATPDYGDRDVGEAWLAAARPAIRLVAVAAYGRRGRPALPALLAALDDELPYMRAWTLFAIEDIVGRRITDAEYDPRAPAERRAEQVRALRAKL